MIASMPSMSKVASCARPQAACIPRSVRAFANKDKEILDSNTPQEFAESVKSTIEDKVNKAGDVWNKNTSFAQDAKSSLEPRVAQLRDEQLSKGLTKREDIMAFSGPLPELVNGRLAMLGFTACLAAEYGSHQTLWQQVQSAPASIALAGAVFIIASLIPIIRGTNIFPSIEKEGNLKSGFTLTNELINGRAAMLGFAIIIIYEAIAGKAIFA